MPKILRSDDAGEHCRTRLAEDADTLMREALVFMDAGESALAAALLDHDDLEGAAMHAVTCSVRARSFLSAFLVHDSPTPTGDKYWDALAASSQGPEQF